MLSQSHLHVEHCFVMICSMSIIINGSVQYRALFTLQDRFCTPKRLKLSKCLHFQTNSRYFFSNNLTSKSLSLLSKPFFAFDWLVWNYRAFSSMSTRAGRHKMSHCWTSMVCREARKTAQKVGTSSPHKLPMQLHFIHQVALVRRQQRAFRSSSQAATRPPVCVTL